MFTWQQIDQIKVDATRIKERISQAAQNELLTKGILGFRVETVAREANCSISVIYRHYIDRSGLIVHVLARIFDQIQHNQAETLYNYFNSMDVIYASDVINAIPHLDESARSINMKWRLLALALSTEEAELRESIENSILSTFPIWQKTIDLIQSKASQDSTFDTRFFSIVFLMHMPYYNMLLREHRIRDDDYKKYLFELMNKLT
jgi:AcrR family transcriptional regulator